MRKNNILPYFNSLRFLICLLLAFIGYNSNMLDWTDISRYSTFYSNFSGGVLEYLENRADLDFIYGAIAIIARENSLSFNIITGISIFFYYYTMMAVLKQMILNVNTNVYCRDGSIYYIIIIASICTCEFALFALGRNHFATIFVNISMYFLLGKKYIHFVVVSILAILTHQGIILFYLIGFAAYSYSFINYKYHFFSHTTSKFIINAILILILLGYNNNLEHLLSTIPFFPERYNEYIISKGQNIFSASIVKSPIIIIFIVWYINIMIRKYFDKIDYISISLFLFGVYAIFNQLFIAQRIELIAPIMIGYLLLKNYKCHKNALLFKFCLIILPLFFIFDLYWYRTLFL